MMRRLSPRKVGILLRRPSGSASRKHQSLALVDLVCSDNTEIRRVVRLSMGSFVPKNGPILVLAKGKGGAQQIPVVGGATILMRTCVSRGELKLTRGAGCPLFAGERRGGLAGRNITCIVGGCTIVTRRMSSGMPRGMEYRVLQRSGTIRLLRTNMGLVCVHSFLKRDSVGAARVCTHTSTRLGHGTLRGTCPSLMSSGLPS